MTDKLISLFAMTLGVEAQTLSDETSPENTERWDSLANMLLIAAIEETFDVELSTGEIESMRSIGVARKVIEAHRVQTRD